MRGALVVFAVALAVPSGALAGQVQVPEPAGKQVAALSRDDLGQVYLLYLRAREQAARRNDPASVKAAIATYREALELAPAAADIRAELANLFADRGDFLEARAEARRAIEAEPEHRQAHRVLGLIESAMLQQSSTPATPEMLQEVIGHLEYALADGATDLQVQLTIAELYLQQGNPARAAAAAQKFLQERPGFPRAVMVLVSALDASGRTAEVGAALAELRDEPAAELLAMAQAFLEGGDAPYVVTLLEPRLAAPQPDDLETGAFGRMAAAVGMAYTRMGQHKRAIAVVEEARARKASGQMLLFTLAAAYERDGQIDNAERTFRTLIADEPQHADALNYLGYMLAERGRKLDEAVQLIQRALVLEPDNPSYLDSLGWAYFQQRRFEDARPPLERAASAAPREGVIQDHLGDLYVELKRYGDAAAAFDRALGGNRGDLDVAAVTKKRDRARELASQK